MSPADLTLMANLAAFLGNRDIDRFLVHIHPDIQLARLADPWPASCFPVDAFVLNVWLCVARHAIHDTEEAGRLLLDRKPFCLTERRAGRRVFFRRIK